MQLQIKGYTYGCPLGEGVKGQFPPPSFFGHEIFEESIENWMGDQ
jgi:hypothetical protein